jgi:hypothetical protein
MSGRSRARLAVRSESVRLNIYSILVELLVNRELCKRVINSERSSKSDSAPVRGEAYEPAGLRTQQSQRRDVAQPRVGGCGGG